MSRTTVKVDIPQGSPEDLISLTDKVLKYHADLGADSPLRGLEMDKVQAALASAKAKRKEAKDLHDKAESLNQQAMLDLGITKSQNTKTAGTVYSTLTSVRDILLGLNRGKEEKLSEWGFKVVVGSVTRSKNAAKVK